MGSLTGLFNTSRTALLADQTAIDATASNISNQNSVNYSKRVVTFTENDTVLISGQAVSTGTTATVSSQRDRVLDQSVAQATDTASSSSARLTALNQLQSIFTLDNTGNDSSGIQTAISGFFTGLSSIAADPTSGSARATALAAAQTLATAFNKASGQITSQTNALNQQVTTSVTQVNQLLGQISSLNGAIGSSLPTDDTSALQDQRTALITQLSGLIGLQQTTTENGSVSLSTTDGTLLLGGTKVYALGTSSIGGTTRVLAAASIGGADITAKLQGGSIGGILKARDTDLPAVKTQLDQLAYGIVRTVNAQNKAGVNALGFAGGDVFVGGGEPNAAASLTVTAINGDEFAAAGVGEGTGGSTNATALVALQNAATVNGQTYSGAYGSLLTGLGTTVSGATTDSSADTAIQTQLTTQRDTVSGVSLDEEAANLTQYQRSYQAASKLLSILNDLLGAAINLGTDTAVS